MKIVGYVRVSTNEQATSGISLKAQAKKVKGYAEVYDLELIEIIQDRGESAKSLHRPGIQKVLGMLRTGEVQGVLVAKLDRLTRSILDLNTLIKDYFGDSAKYESTLFSVADHVDTRTAAGRLVLNVLMSVAQWERETISERTKAALSHKKENGEWLGAPSMGVEIQDGKVIKNQKEIKVLRYVLKLRNQGLTYRAIAKRLNDEGIETKRGKRWKAQTVSNALKVAKEVA